MTTLDIKDFIETGSSTAIRQPDHRWEPWWDHHPTTRYGSSVDHQQIDHNWWYGRHWHDQIYGGLTLHWDSARPSKSFHDLNSPYSRSFNVALETYYYEQGYSLMWLFTFFFEMMLIALFNIRKNANYIIAAVIVAGSSYWFTQDNADKQVLIQQQQHTLQELQTKQKLTEIAIAFKASEVELRNKQIKEIQLEKEQMKQEMQALRESQNNLSAAFLNLQTTLVKENMQKNTPSRRTSFDHNYSRR